MFRKWRSPGVEWRKLNHQNREPKYPTLMKTRFLTLGVVLGISAIARADYTPIAIDPSSFNQDPVIEAAAPKSLAEPPIVTHTADGGTNKTGNTWYEIGY